MKRILIADDEEHIRESIRVALEGQHYEIIEADNGATALDLARSRKPHLIISDIMMDSGSGFLLRELLREDDDTALIPIILMTGNVQWAGAWKSDPDVEYLDKPFRAAELLAAIGRAMQRAYGRT